MKVELTLNGGIADLISRFTVVAGTTPDILISRIVNGRFQEMGELLEFARGFTKGSNEYNRACDLLTNYDGGEYVFRAMKEIDPKYQTPEEFFTSIDDAILDGLAASLNDQIKASS